MKKIVIAALFLASGAFGANAEAGNATSQQWFSQFTVNIVNNTKAPITVEGTNQTSSQEKTTANTGKFTMNVSPTAVVPAPSAAGRAPFSKTLLSEFQFVGQPVSARNAAETSYLVLIPNSTRAIALAVTIKDGMANITVDGKGIAPTTIGIAGDFRKPGSPGASFGFDVGSHVVRVEVTNEDWGVTIGNRAQDITFFITDK